MATTTWGLRPRRGVEVRDIPGAAHSVWYSHFDDFMAAIDDRY